LHGGTVEAQSNGAGQGSELIVRLPIFSREAAHAVPVSRDSGPAPGSRDGAVRREAPGPGTGAQPGVRILVVEDDVDAAETLVELLGFWGFDVRSATDGNSALDIASEFHPHVALIDIGLPGMDGYELARRLRQSETGDERPLLIGLSGYAQERDRSEGVKAGFDHHFAKPLKTDTLKQFLAHTFEPPTSAPGEK
jgi:CheY-like chemotaxis protein